MCSTIRKPKYRPGEVVFDMPSQANRTILSVEWAPYDDQEDFFVYHVESPDNPTGDGAFPGSARCEFEIGPRDVHMPLSY